MSVQTVGEHLVALPEGGGLRSLVVLLGGTGSTPEHYRGLSTELAAAGHGVLDLRYPNADAVGMRCFGDDACFTQARGTSVFGAGVLPQAGIGPFSCSGLEVDARASVVGALVALLDELTATHPELAGHLVADPASPYSGTRIGPARPAWDRITLAGHSQGGGHAAFLATLVPVGRLVLLASPNDNVDGVPASWTRARATPPERIWGIRHAHEAMLGEHVPSAWAALTDGAPEVDVGDGSGDPGASRLLVISEDHGDPFQNHSSMAVDGIARSPVHAAWTHVFGT